MPLSDLLKNKIISPLDLHFAKFMEDLSGGNNTDVALAAALVSRSTRMGHICLDLAPLAGRPLEPEGGDSGPAWCPNLSRWTASLEGSSVVGRPGEFAPLIMDGSRLYLHRYRTYEKEVGEAISGRFPSDAAEKEINFELLKEGLGRLFPEDGEPETNWQKVAAFSSVIHKFCVISGGPGTGKTTTVVKILVLLLEQEERARIGLAAPTGKAAARLRESLLRAKDSLDCPDAVKEAIPEEVSTLHRLLGSIPNSPYFRHNAENSLPFNIVVVDEASQVDLPLMAKLIRALPRDGRLILLGDAHQLASVQPGAVLGDICGGKASLGFSKEFLRKCGSVAGESLEVAPENSLPALVDGVVHLGRNYRFPAGGGMDSLARAVKEGKAEEALKILEEGGHPDITWREIPGPDHVESLLAPKILENFRQYLEADDISLAFPLFDRFRILSAVREGPFGVVALNELAERTLIRAGLIRSGKEWYEGRPIMVARNDYNLNLFNGDVGIIWSEWEEGGARAFFPGADGAQRKLLPQTLPEHETVFAMTVHKSQGSEFDRVLLVLPHIPSPILTRELIYTGITRARKGVEIWGKAEIFCHAVNKRVERTSGLREMLWGEGV